MFYSNDLQNKNARRGVLPAAVVGKGFRPVIAACSIYGIATIFTLFARSEISCGALKNRGIKTTIDATYQTFWFFVCDTDGFGGFSIEACHRCFLDRCMRSDPIDYSGIGFIIPRSVMTAALALRCS